MVWLDICDEQGNSIYFDIHHVERRRSGRRWRHAVNGVCGNGQFEVEVLVESGERNEVTFVDLSSGAVSGQQLLGGVDLFRLESGLICAAIERCSMLKRPAAEAPRFLPHPTRFGHQCVNERGPSWQVVA